MGVVHVISVDSSADLWVWSMLSVWTVVLTCGCGHVISVDSSADLWVWSMLSVWTVVLTCGCGPCCQCGQ